MTKKIISTDAAPAAIGPYSQALQVGRTVYISGQIPLDPNTMEMVPGGFVEQAQQVFKNLQAVIQAAGADFTHAVKLNIYLTDLADFASVNEVMMKYCSEPYPARAAVQVAALPIGALVEVDAVLCLD